MRLIFMGMGGPLSSAPLHALLQAKFEFSAVIVAAAHKQKGWRALPRPGRGRRSVPLLPLQPAVSIVQLAWEHDIALFEVGNLQAREVQGELERLAPDVVLVSCFAYRVPVGLLRIPHHGFLNLHPSRLPAYRGPYPIFWQLRDGLSQIGVTVQRMDERLDTGPIALQAAVEPEDGMVASQIEQLAGREGGRLFTKALRALAAGELSFEAQQGDSSYQGRPRESDFALNTRWTARRAFNFMRGTADWGQPYPVVVGRRRWLLRRALAFDPTGVQSTPVQASDNRIRIQFSEGILEAV